MIVLAIVFVFNRQIYIWHFIQNFMTLHENNFNTKSTQLIIVLIMIINNFVFDV
jgi:hypothetical protein